MLTRPRSNVLTKLKRIQFYKSLSTNRFDITRCGIPGSVLKCICAIIFNLPTYNIQIFFAKTEVHLRECFPRMEFIEWKQFKTVYIVWKSRLWISSSPCEKFEPPRLWICHADCAHPRTHPRFLLPSFMSTSRKLRSIVRTNFFKYLKVFINELR